MVRLIETGEGLVELATEIRRAGRIALDVETNGLHAYRSRVCLIQVAFPEGTVVIVDVLAAGGPAPDSPLAGVLADAAVAKVLHGASHDVASLREDFGAALRGIFDTHVAATLLGRPKVGLADLVAEVHGVTLSKGLQKCDWAARPLTPEMLSYLEKDVAYLLGIADRLREDLEAAGIVEEAQIEFRRVEETPATGWSFDPAGYFSIPGAKDLDDRGLAVLRAVWIERDRIAREIDRPPFKVLPEGVLLGLAKRPRWSRRALEGYRALRDRRLRPYLGSLHEAIERGAAAGRPPDSERPENRPRPEAQGPRLSRAEREAVGRRADALRAWRKAEAHRRGLPTVTVLPNPVLHEIARKAPPTIEALAAIDGLGRSRAARYGATILDLVRRA